MASVQLRLFYQLREALCVRGLLWWFAPLSMRLLMPLFTSFCVELCGFVGAGGRLFRPGVFGCLGVVFGCHGVRVFF